MSWAKISGGLGALLLISSPITYLLTGSSVLGGGKAILGALLLALYVGVQGASVRQLVSKRSTRSLSISALLVLTVLAVLAVINVAAARRNKTWDFTTRKLYSLSPQTVSVLKGLKDDVRAIAFVPATHQTFPLIEEMLGQYQREAPEHFSFTFAVTPQLVSQYQLRADQPVVVLTQGEIHKTLPVVYEQGGQPGKQILSEQDLTNGLLRLDGSGEQKAYFLAGHGEQSFEQMSKLVRSLTKEGYAPISIHLASRSEVPKDAALLVMAGPHEPLAAPEAALLRAYLANGGRLLYFADAHTEPLLAEYGIQIDPGTVADDKFNAGSPYVVLSVFYSEHVMTQELRATQLNVELSTSRGLTVLRDTQSTATPIVLTSPSAWVETTPNDQPEPSPGEKTGQIPLVVASLRGKTRLVVFGDSELLLDGHWGGEGNRNLVLNAFAWTAEQPNGLTVRPPDREISTIELDSQRLARIRFIATDLFPLTLLGVGIAIWIARRNK
ncbi:MAG: GldG family protein [Myxococcaceae bacterium]